MKNKHTNKIKSFDIENKDLAIELGDLYYDSLADFLAHLAQKLEDDGDKDYSKKRLDLAYNLYMASKLISDAAKHIDKSWEISEPFVNEFLEKNND